MKDLKASAGEQVLALFMQASKEPDKAKKLVAAARKIAAKSRIKISAAWRRRFCRACNAFFVPGVNCRTRIKNKLIVVTCLECKRIRRLKR